MYKNLHVIRIFSTAISGLFICLAGKIQVCCQLATNAPDTAAKARILYKDIIYPKLTLVKLKIIDSINKLCDVIV